MNVTRADRRALAITTAAVAGFAVAEGMLSGDGPTKWYPGLRKSRLVLPLWAFVPAALLYYLICAAILFRLLTRALPGSAQRAAVAQLLTVMAANAGWNYLLFGLRSTGAGLAGMLGFVVLTLRLLSALRQADERSAALLLPYVAWLGYDLVYAFELWRLNHRD